MKRITLLIIILLCLAPVLSYAKKAGKTAGPSSLDKELEQEMEAERQSLKAKKKVAGKKTVPYKRLLISLHGGFGISFPSGDISGDGDQAALAAMGYTGGLSLCYRFFSLGGPVVGAEFAGKQITTERSWMGSKLESTITATTVNVMAGWRFILVKMLYIEPGL